MLDRINKLDFRMEYWANKVINFLFAKRNYIWKIVVINFLERWIWWCIDK